MNPHLRHNMFEHYNERAPEYEEAYTLGTGTTSMTDPRLFTTEATLLANIVQGFVHGRVIDLACGTAYWLPQYASGCSRITLFDQSEKMLEETRRKVERLGVGTDAPFCKATFSPTSSDAMPTTAHSWVSF
jgi:ubiquinone/menaquinone biosynthesis C-methylase UbiE